MILLLLLVWIDDILCAFTRGGYDLIFMPFYKTYTTKFPAKIHGAVRRFIGLDCLTDRALGTVSISQETYISNMVPKFVSVASLSATPEYSGCTWKKSSPSAEATYTCARAP